jgi:hypothetical protein
MVVQNHKKYRIPTRPSASGQAPASSPWADQDVIKKSPFESATDWLVNAHSPKGMMVIGWSIFLSSQVLNSGFWISVCSGAGAISTIKSALLPDLMALGAVLAGVGVSGGSTFFQGYPIVQSRAKDNIFSELLSIAFQPKTSSIPGQVDPDRAHDYNDSNRRFNALMRKLGKFSTLIEVFAGMLFMGVIFGGGFGALLSLAAFIYSIIGSQVGLSMIVQARNVALDATGRHASRKLAANARSEAFKAIK